MTKINVYDFDGTIYKGDSSVDFFLFCLRRHSENIFLLLKIAFAFIQYKVHFCSKEHLKSVFFSFLKNIEDIDSVIEESWNNNFYKIDGWYKSQSAQSDVIISASPEFLLAPVCKQMGVRLIASKVDKKTGKFIGNNCYGKEKVLRLQQFLDAQKESDCELENFYSDSKSDFSLASMAEKSWLVKFKGKKVKIIKWI